MADEVPPPRAAATNDIVEIVVPQLSLELPPVPQFESLAFADAPAASAEYLSAVATCCGEWSLQDKQAVTDFLLRLYNAANYFGELCPSEQRVVDPAICRVTNVPLPPAKDESAIGKGAADAFAAELVVYQAMRKKRDRQLRLMLQVDGEVANTLVQLPAVLLALRGIASTIPKNDVWRLRVLYRHHQALERAAHTLFVDLADSVDALREGDDVEALVEVSFVQNSFNKEELAAAAAYKAMHLSGLQLEESAMVGVRTRYQTIKHVQSILLATSAAAPEPLSDAEKGRSMPETMEAEAAGHDLYDRPRDEAGSDAKEEKPLHLRDHAIVLALCHNINNSNPAYGLTKHHIQVYAERLLIDKTDPVYALRAMTLLVRARVEYGRNRVQQRAFMQLQNFIDTFPAASALHERPTFYRTDPKYAFAVHWPPVWSLRREYGSECYDLTMFRTALTQYEAVEDWDMIIKCCGKLDRRRKAEMLARERIDEEPENPTLWVALGEATRDEGHLWKAWELSGKRMAAPMRALARLALDREQWTKVIDYFNEAVAINPVFGGDWFTLGYACLRLNDLDQAARAFTRVCQMDSDNSFAWTNLGNVLMRQKRFRAAFCAMSQALRHDRSNWRMWGNYWAVGVHLLEVREATHALHTAIGIAGRDFVFEDKVMLEYTDMAVRFLDGELTLTDNVANEDASEFAAVPTANTDDNAAATEEAAASGPVVEEATEEECAMEALFVDSDDDDNGIMAAAADRRREETATAERAARNAYRERMRRVFETLISNFVDNPELYASCARIWRKLDGPEGEFKFRLKEIREAKKHLWERSETQYRRVLQAIRAAGQVATELATPDAKRQALEAADNAVKSAVGNLDSLPVYQEAEELRLQISRITIR